ncbi:hypothetical protein T01_5212 [Trichinella spiralis]|uniref:Uncharacterized protein n=1 Tax=Trichinella spiralis TaxID=6334 RepID=A0A0V1B0Y4_TRISP|nr:hypothetical protein T01_5212 [Trichinella spiralis]
MADISALRLAANRCGDMLFFNKEGCEGAIWRNQDVTAVLTQKDRIKRCRADEHLAHKTEKAVRKKKC